MRNPDDPGPAWFLDLAAVTPNSLALHGWPPLVAAAPSRRRYWRSAVRPPGRQRVIGPRQGIFLAISRLNALPPALHTTGRFDDGKDRHGVERDVYEQRLKDWMGPEGDEHAEDRGSGSSAEEDDGSEVARGKYTKWRRCYINKDTIEFQMGGADTHDAPAVVEEWRRVADNVRRVSRTPRADDFQFNDVLRGLLRGLVSVITKDEGNGAG